MTIQEAKSAIEELKAQGSSEEEVAGAFYLMFRDGKLTLDQLNGLVNLLGYHLTEEFLSMDPEAQKEAGMKDASEELSEDEVEETKEVEDKAEDKEESEPEPKEAEAEEEDEESKAMRLFGNK